MTLRASSNYQRLEPLIGQGFRLCLARAPLAGGESADGSRALLGGLLLVLERFVKNRSEMSIARVSLDRLREIPVGGVAVELFAGFHPWLAITLSPDDSAGVRPVSMFVPIVGDDEAELASEEQRLALAVPYERVVVHADEWAAWDLPPPSVREPAPIRLGNGPVTVGDDEAGAGSAPSAVTLFFRITRRQLLGDSVRSPSSQRRRATSHHDVREEETVVVPEIAPNAKAFLGRMFNAVMSTVAPLGDRVSSDLPAGEADRRVVVDLCARLVVRELQLHLQVADFHDVNRKKNQLLSVAAHDLRHPVVMVREYAALALEELAEAGIEPVAPRVQEPSGVSAEAGTVVPGPGATPVGGLGAIAGMIERMQSLSDYSLQMVNDVLDFAQIQAGEFDLKFSPLDLGEFAAEVRDMHHFQAAAKGIRLDFQAPKGESFSTDQRKLLQLANNIVSNAIKYSPKASTVRFIIESEATEVRLTFADEGVGIAADEIDRLFVPFRKGSVQPTAGEHSTGLGLAIVKKIIDVLGGRIQVNSTVGGGSTFVVTLPRNPGSEEERIRPYTGDTLLLPLGLALQRDTATDYALEVPYPVRKFPAASDAHRDSAADAPPDSDPGDKGTDPPAAPESASRGESRPHTTG